MFSEEIRNGFYLLASVIGIGAAAYAILSLRRLWQADRAKAARHQAWQLESVQFAAAYAASLMTEGKVKPDWREVGVWKHKRLPGIQWRVYDPRSFHESVTLAEGYWDGSLTHVRRFRYEAEGLESVVRPILYGHHTPTRTARSVFAFALTLVGLPATFLSIETGGEGPDGLECYYTDKSGGELAAHATGLVHGSPEQGAITIQAAIDLDGRHLVSINSKHRLFRYALVADRYQLTEIT